MKDQLQLIKEAAEKIRKLKVLVIGDTIIDHYVFVHPKGRAIKDPILSVEYVNEEKYAGGILAIAKHISDFVSEVGLFTLLGSEMTHDKLVEENLPNNAVLKSFIRQNSPTTIKKRYIDSTRNTKLFKVEHIDDTPLQSDLEDELLNSLESILPKYDLVVRL